MHTTIDQCSVHTYFTMKTREEIIYNMCMTANHAYGFGDLDHPIMGMTKEKREGLYNQMAQIYDNDIKYILNELNKEISMLKQKLVDTTYRKC